MRGMAVSCGHRLARGAHGWSCLLTSFVAVWSRIFPREPGPHRVSPRPSGERVSEGRVSGRARRPATAPAFETSSDFDKAGFSILHCASRVGETQRNSRSPSGCRQKGAVIR